MKRKISKAQFVEWKHFYEVRPFGDEWEDLRFGTMTARVCSSMGGVPDGMRFDKFIEVSMPLIYGRDNKWRGRTTPEEQIAIFEGAKHG